MEWISVKDRLPGEYTDVLCLYNNDEYGIDYVNTKGLFMADFPIQPNYWMPLPEPPKM